MSRLIRILISLLLCFISFTASAADLSFRQMSPDEDYADAPSLLVLPNGDAWYAWVGYDQKGADEIRLRHYAKGRWGEQRTVSPEPGDYFKTALAVDGDGQLWISWAARINGNVDLYACTIKNGRQSGIQRLTTDPNPDFHHRMVADKQGRLFLCWQSYRKGNADIYMKVYDGKQWGDDIAVTNHQASDWEPAIAVDGQNRLHVVYDTYRHGDYDVYLRTWSNGTLSKEQPIAATKKFEGRATIACAPDDRLWIAWDEQGESWGLDKPYWTLDSARGDWGPLAPWNDERTPSGVAKSVSIRWMQSIGYAVYQNGKLLKPLARIDEILPPVMKESLEIPHFQFDSKGTAWLYFRRWIRRGGPDSDMMSERPAGWHIYATAYTGEQWSDIIQLPESIGSNDQRISTAIGPDGETWVAYPADGRMNNGRVPGPSGRHGKVYLTSLKPQSGPVPQLQALSSPANKSDKRTAFAGRRHSIEADGKSYQLYWGDLHRHTEISGDGGYDGTVWDMYRYAIDAAELDFIATTDHNYGGNGKDDIVTTYDWWRTQKMADLFHVAGKFLPLFGYERSMNWPYGHRNVISPDRGITSFDQTVPKSMQNEDSPRQPDELRLWDNIRDKNAISIPHTLASGGGGTNWAFNDQQLETLMEIYQGCRNSYETSDGPRGSVGSNKYQGGYAWSALGKGYKVGFIASSDHRSTHLSYAAVYAEEPTRASIFQGLQKRHTYAATENIVLDVRIGNAIMGDIITVNEPPEINIMVRGTGPIHQIDIIRNNAYIYTDKPNRAELTMKYRDTEPVVGDNYYYVRILQEDSQVAWGTPIWVNYRP
jgi:hypothetical protein